MLIAVSGNLGAGKTSLITHMANFYPTIKVHMEEPERNPFTKLIIERSPAMLGFELYFLFESVRSYIKANKSDEIHVIERTFEENCMFGRKMLTGHELTIYESVCSYFKESFIYCPDLIVYLDASYETLMHNMERRNNPIVDVAPFVNYPKMMVEDYKRYKTEYVDKRKHLIINIDQIDINKKANEILANIFHRLV